MIVLKWAWRYFSLDVEEFDTLEEAVASARHAADAGHEALDCIEVVEEDGTSRTLTMEDVESYFQSIRKAESAEVQARDFAVLFLRPPEGTEDCPLLYCATAAEAEAEVARLSPIFGPRLSVRHL